MSRQTLAVIIGAIALFGVGVFGALSFTGEDSGTPTMTMPDGSTMPADQMPADQMTTEGAHTMDDGSTMSDQEMP